MLSAVNIANENHVNTPASPISYLSCKIGPGMFSNEYAVSITLVSGQMVSLFADKELIDVNGSDSHGHLKVNIVENASGESVVLLPSETLETGTRWIQVSPESIQHS
jgi:hypothetical protein